MAPSTGAEMSAWLSAMSRHPNTQICPTCKHSLVGLAPDEIFHVYCPECGDYVRPISVHDLESQTKNHTTIILIILGLLALLGVLAFIAVILFIAFMISATSS